MYKILIADDEFLIRTFLRKIITEQLPECEVCAEAEDGTDGLTLAESTRPDIIITDICMSEMSGLDMVQRLTALSCRPKIIILTAHREFAYAKKAIELGVSGFILKPTKANEVVEQVRLAIKKIRADRAQPQSAQNDDVLYKLYRIHVLSTELIRAVRETDRAAAETLLAQIFAEAAAVPDDSRDKLLHAYSDIAAELYSLHDPRGGRHQLSKPAFDTCTDRTELDLALRRYAERVLDTLTSGTYVNETSMRINKVFEYIENNYMSNITAQNIADYIHISPSYLSKLFKQETGKNLVDWINEYRVTVAKGMIDSCEYKMYEISEKVGFENAHYFTKVFRKYIGMTPTEYMNHKKGI